jgi:hypothetical protein
MVNNDLKKFMAFKYLVESMGGDDYWQIVCEDSETRDRIIIGKDLHQKYAQELTVKLQAAADAEVEGAAYNERMNRIVE